VVNGLMAYGRSHPDAVPTCTLIPLGTGNDIAKSFGIQIADQWSPRELRRAVATLVHGADYRMDLGCLGGRYFADALTIGLDSRILRARNEGRRRLARFPLLRRLVRGRLLYTLSTGRPFLSQVPVQTEITVDGRPWYTGPMINVVVNNTRIYAGAFDFSVDAYADDGRLDVVLFSGHTDYLARYLLSIRHNPERIRQLSERLSAVSSHTQGREIRIRVSRPEPAQMDGEELPDADGFDITVAPRAIRIKTPAEPV
jgi:diacylglycerol kinase family enzyme